MSSIMKVELTFADGTVREYKLHEPLHKGLSRITFCHPRDGEVFIGELEAGVLAKTEFRD